MNGTGFIDALLSQAHLPLPLYCMARMNREQLLKTICAYLNADGGWIVVGVDDEKNVLGIESSTSKYVQDAIVDGICPLPLVYVQEDVIDDKHLLLVTVMKGSLSPYTYKGAYYVMIGDVVVQPNMDQLAMMLRDSSVLSSWESDNCLMADTFDLDESLMNEVYENGKLSGRIHKGEIGLEQTLSELHLMTVNTVTNGAMALFAKETRRFIPQARVRIQLMLNGKSAEVYDDTTFIEGNIFRCLEETIRYFKDRLPFVSRFSSSKSGRDDSLLYPIEVIDEAVSNALIHRNYDDRMGEITIFIYRNRIEITNSGEMSKDILSAKNKVKPHGSILRNPLMAEVFYIAGKMEKTGRGLQLITDVMKSGGYKLPEWTIGNGKTTLTIYSNIKKKSVPERAKRFLSQLHVGDSFTKVEYMGGGDKPLSKGTAQNDIIAMQEAGLIELVGNGPSTRYVVK